ALDRAQGRFRRPLLAAEGGGHGAEAVPETVPADLVRRRSPGRGAARGQARRRLLRGRLPDHGPVRGAGEDRARGPGRERPGDLRFPDREAGVHRSRWGRGPRPAADRGDRERTVYPGWETYHLKGSPAEPDRLYASQSSSWFGQVLQRSDDGGKTWETVGNEFQYDGTPGTHLWYDGSPHPWEFKRVWHLE